MNLKEIIQAVVAGKTVHWGNIGYTVVRDKLGQFLIVHHQGSCVGLTNGDGVLDENESDFFIV